MFLVDSSVWVDVLRDRTGARRLALDRALGDEGFALTRVHQLELLQGCRDEREWATLHSYLEVQEYLDLAPGSWSEAARIHFELRRQGKSVRSPLDCCIAQAALDHDARLLHRDRDFVTIASVRPLRHSWLDW